MRTFIDATKDKPLGIVWGVAIQAGLRRGELAGLRWTAVDLTAGGRFWSR